MATPSCVYLLSTRNCFNFLPIMNKYSMVAGVGIGQTYPESPEGFLHKMSTGLPPWVPVHPRNNVPFNPRPSFFNPFP